MRSRLVLALLLPGENSRGVTRQAAELLPAALLAAAGSRRGMACARVLSVEDVLRCLAAYDSGAA